MKTLKNILTIALFTGVTTAMAQVPPAPPAPPAAPNKTVSTASSTRNSSVIVQNGDYGKGGNTSFSVSNSNDEYRVKARYPKNRYPALKEYLQKELKSQSKQEDGDSMVWWLEGDDDTVFEVRLDNDRLKIEMYKELASTELISKFVDMGDVLRTLISGGNHRQEISRLEREADRARRDAERMQREAERLQAISERDAARLSQEAALLEQEAAKLSLVSKRGGGIDGYVREVLRQPSTTYQPNTTDNNDWKWPAMQNALLTQLKKDNLITGDEDIVFVKEDTGIYVNGDKLNPSAWSSYNSLFRKYDYEYLEDLSFYKQGNHIAVVNSAPDLEDLLEELELAGLIRDSKKEIRVEINGASVKVDGFLVTASETSTWNKYLHKHSVIPAPGKTIITGKDFASIGYSFDKSTLGTWVSRD